MQNQVHSSFTFSPCRINNSSRWSNSYGPRAFEGPAVICKYFANDIQKHYLLKVKFFILFGNLLLRERIIHTANCLKSFYFKLFFVYTSCGGAFFFRKFAHNFALFWQIHDLLQSLLNVALEWLISFLTKDCKN